MCTGTVLHIFDCGESVSVDVGSGCGRPSWTCVELGAALRLFV